MLNSIKQYLKNNIKSPLIKKIYRGIFARKEVLRYLYIHEKIRLHALKYHRLPLEKKIVFLNFDGRGYGCNPKYIAEEILNRKLDYDLVWLVSRNYADMPQEIRQVDINSEECYRELATAKVIINNVKGEIKFRKKTNQYYIQTWHAGFSPKLLELDAKDTLPKDYLLESRNNSKDTDLFLSNSIAQTEEYKRAFWCNCEILECGLPRNDIFFKITEDDILKVKKKLGVSEKNKVIMYAPTFRSEDDSINGYGIDIREIKNAINEHFKCNCDFLLRMHPNIKNNQQVGEDVIDVSKYPDMQELLAASDIIITDYSSSIYDAIEMNKVVFVFANDIEEYKKTRGFKQDFYDLSIGISQNNDELIKSICSFNYDDYAEKISMIKAKYCTFDKGNAATAVVNRIVEWMMQ